jgi:hypothetical protein
MIQINPLLHEEESFTQRSGPLARRRVNLLLLLDAAEQADLTPLPSQQLHRMAFLANGLSPIYDVPIVDGEILKYRRGPFYSDLQWDVDRLVFMGFAEISNIRHERDEHGWWFFADYALSQKGIGTVEQVIAAITSARERHAFYLEVAGAYSTLRQEGRDDAALEDANFRNEDALLDFVIDFSEPETNFSAQAANGFSRLAPAGVSLSNRDKLYLYFRYLNRMVERAAG